MRSGPGKLNGSHSVLVNLVIIFYPILLFSQDLIITELYRNPDGIESVLCGGKSHEFVEIINPGPDTFFVDNFFLSDGVETDSILPFGMIISGHDSCVTNQPFLAPGQIGLILDSDYKVAVEKQGCALPISKGVVLFTCADAELGNGLSDDEGILLYKGSRNRIDSIVCLLSDSQLESESPVSGKIVFSDPENIEGHSIVATRFLSDKKSFNHCPTNVSPGWLEFMQRGWIVEFIFGSYVPFQENVSCTLLCICINPDLQANKFNYSLTKGGSVILQGMLSLEKNRAQMIIPLQVDSVDYRFIIDNTEWKIDMSSIFLPHSPLKINEIYPFGTQLESEWYELVNVTSMPINLKNWKAGNFEDTSVITNSEYLLEPGAFLVIVKNKQLFLHSFPGISSALQPQVWHTLNNSGDTLCIFDSEGNMRDIVCYRYSWFGNTHKPIERVNSTIDGCDSTNWAISTGGGTPGFPNGALFWRNVSEAEIKIGPIPFTPNQDGKDDLLSIKLSLPASFKVNLCIYDFRGAKVRCFNGPVRKQYFWDGKADNGKVVQCGPFFVVAELTSTRGTTLLRKKGILWR